MRLKGKRAIVTGGSSGIGRGIAIEFANEGADVAIGDLRLEPKGEPSTPTAEEIRERGRQSMFVKMDVADANAAKRLVDTATDELGGIDIVVNNAGITPEGSVETISEADWDRTFDVNVKGIRNVSKHALSDLRDSDAGRIVNISSQLGIVARHDFSAYCASKAAIMNLTRQMAIDYADEGITVNAVNPGIIQTRTNLNEDRRARVESYNLLPDVGRPEDIGRAVVFLASEDGRYVTGHCLVVDGGYTVH